MRVLFIIIGGVSLLLGVIGIVIPLLPTTPFLLLAATLFMHGSPRLHNWLINTPCLGKYIRDYKESRAMPLRAKIVSMVTLWGTIIYCVVVVADQRLWLQLLLIAIAVAVSWHILRLATLPKRESVARRRNLKDGVEG